MQQIVPLKRCQGIILKTLPYADYDAIITLFTREEGLLTMILKQAYRSKRAKQTSPFTEGEIAYVPGRETLHKCREITPQTMHLMLRTNYRALQAACTIATALSASQLPQKPAPLLYQLLCSSLKMLPKTEVPELISSSFQLKLLKHDGELKLKESCSSCHTPLTRGFYCVEGEVYCSKHTPSGAILFSEKEGKQLIKMADATSFKELFTIELSEDLPSKVLALFSSHYCRK